MQSINNSVVGSELAFGKDFSENCKSRNPQARQLFVDTTIVERISIRLVVDQMIVKRKGVREAATRRKFTWRLRMSEQCWQ